MEGFMKSQVIKVIVNAPDDMEEVINRYTMAVFLVLRKKVSIEHFSLLIENLSKNK
jgi:uncharacterized protein (DUF2267 family)